MNAQDAWNAAYGQLQLQLDRANFETWLQGATFLDLEESVYVIGVRNSYARDMLQHRLYRNVRRVLSDVCGEEVELRFEVSQAETPPLPRRKRRALPSATDNNDDTMPLFQFMAQNGQADIPEEAPLHERIRRPHRADLPENELNSAFNFNRFIVYGGNNIAYEAACAITEGATHLYNPFLIYGGVGLGKTHLLQAIAHSYESCGLRAVYIPSEAFTNDLIDAIRHKTTAMFRDKYRTADVLLVDDIQFIAGKDSTQEEFFHTFNALHSFNKQIVLASDRHPRELTTLEDRLRSRFEGGLITDIQPPDYESRLAILGMWAEERKVDLSRGVLEMVAEKTSVNVRELYGVFNQIVAKAQLSSSRVTIQGATDTLEHYNRPRTHNKRSKTRIAPEAIITAVATYYRLNEDDIMGKKRAGRINHARQVAMYLMRDLTETSLSQIGDYFAGRSHTTVLHGCNKIAEEAEHDVNLVSALNQLSFDLKR